MDKLEPIVDPPYTRLNINDLSNDQLEALVEQKREERLKSFVVYQKALEEKERARTAKAKEKLEKQCAMFATQLTRIDKALEKLQDRANNIRACRIEAGIPDF